MMALSVSPKISNTLGCQITLWVEPYKIEDRECEETGYHKLTNNYILIYMIAKNQGLDFILI